MDSSNTLVPIRNLFGGNSAESIQERFRIIYTRAQEATSNQPVNVNSSESTTLDLAAIDRILLNQFNEQHEERAETPPPSYNEASCLPSYNEACVLIPSLELKKYETHITPNPIQTFKTEDALYVVIPNDTLTDVNVPQILVSNRTQPNSSSSLTNSCSHDDNVTQQISNSIFGAYSGILQLLNGDSVGEEAVSNSPPDASHPSSDVTSSHTLVQNQREQNTERSSSISQIVSSAYSTVINTGNQLVHSFQTPSQPSNTERIPVQTVIHDSQPIENRAGEGISVEEPKDDYRYPSSSRWNCSRFDDACGFHDNWCKFFVKQINIIFQCFCYVLIAFMALFVLWRLIML